jgi:hypothetical protein
MQYFQDTSRMWSGIDTTQALRIEVGQRALAATQVISEEAAIQRWATLLNVPDWPGPLFQIRGRWEIARRMVA